MFFDSRKKLEEAINSGDWLGTSYNRYIEVSKKDFSDIQSFLCSHKPDKYGYKSSNDLKSSKLIKKLGEDFINKTEDIIIDMAMGDIELINFREDFSILVPAEPIKDPFLGGESIFSAFKRKVGQESIGFIDLVKNLANKKNILFLSPPEKRLKNKIYIISIYHLFYLEKFLTDVSYPKNKTISKLSFAYINYVYDRDKPHKALF
jgi:hypothetical protein